MQERMTLCNMAAELGAQAGIIAPDAVTLEWLSQFAPECTPAIDISALASDEASHSGPSYQIDLDALKPQVAAPHSPANSAPLTEHEKQMFNVAYIGACTGAKLDDLRAAAQILSGRKIAGSMQLLVAPASKRDQEAATEEGILEIFEDAGARFLPAACGMCAGYGADRLGADDICISSTARNFKGRMGDPGSQVWLASPATVAASAITGYLSDPRLFI